MMKFCVYVFPNTGVCVFFFIIINFLILKALLIERSLFYNIVLVSAIQQQDSAVGRHMSPPAWTCLPPPTPSHPSRLSQSPSLRSLNRLPWLSVLHAVACMFSPYSLRSSHPALSVRPTLSFPPYPQVCFLCLRLHCCCLATKSFRLFATPWIVVSRVLLSMGFPRQESWSGFPDTSSGYLPDPGIEPGSPAWQAVSLPLSIAALQKGSSVPSFQIPYMCINMQYLFFSF